MPNFESTPNLNNSELNRSESQTDVNTEKKSGGETTPEELNEKNMKGQESEEQGLSPEKKLENLEDKIEIQQEIDRLTESVEGTKSKLNEVRGKLNLPLDEEDPISTSPEKDKLEQLKVEQEGLKSQKEEFANQQEKEQLIHEEKEKILQEKLDELSKEFEALSPDNLESISDNGKTPEGRDVESKSMGSLDPKSVQFLAKSFKEGIKLIPKILKVLPDLLKKLDEDLTKEATERVNEKSRKEEEKKTEKSNSSEEKKDSEDKVMPNEAAGKTNPNESSNVETSKV